MNDAVKQALKDIVANHGPEVLDDPRQTVALLREVCKDQRQEIGTLTGVLAAKVARELRDAADAPFSVTERRVVQRVLRECAMDEATARETVRGLAEVLGLGVTPEKSPGQISKDGPAGNDKRIRKSAALRETMAADSDTTSIHTPDVSEPGSPRPLWPWLVGALAVLLLGVGGWAFLGRDSSPQPEQTTNTDPQPDPVVPGPKNGPGEIQKTKPELIEKKKPEPDGKEEKVKPEETERPSLARVASSIYTGPGERLPTYLLTRQGDGPWTKLEPRNQVYTSDTLMALPGFVCHLRGQAGTDLYLRGSVPEFNLVPTMRALFESVVVLHENKNFDLDLTLVRGRIFLRNAHRQDKATKVRMRFEQELWTLVLEKDAEVGIDLYHEYTPLINARKGEKPVAVCNIAVLEGEVGVTHSFKTVTVKARPGQFALLTYRNEEGLEGPNHFAEPPLLWKLQPPPVNVLPDGWRKPVEEVKNALGQMEAMLGKKGGNEPRSVLAACKAMREDRGSSLASRLLALYCLSAIDEVVPVLSVLQEDAADRDLDRKMACKVLTHWTGRGPQTYQMLSSDDGRSGLLAKAGLRPTAAAAARDLFYPFPLERLRQTETYETLANLLTKQPLVAELAFWHLSQLLPPDKLPSGFNAADEPAQRDLYARKIHKMIEAKELPPGSR